MQMWPPFFSDLIFSFQAINSILQHLSVPPPKKKFLKGISECHERVCMCVCWGKQQNKVPLEYSCRLSGMKVAISPTAGSAAGRQSSAVSCLQEVPHPKTPALPRCHAPSQSSPYSRPGWCVGVQGSGCPAPILKGHLVPEFPVGLAGSSQRLNLSFPFCSTLLPKSTS